jgi:peptidoglycan/LPS O-acetylase OafA/YrhL
MSSFNVAPLDNPMTRALGKVSFSLYLSHHLVMAVLNKMMSIRGLPGLLILTVLTVVIAGAISWALYRFIEQPGIRIGRAFSLGSQTPASGEPAPSQRW